jgi:hypothetical protein
VVSVVVWLFDIEPLDMEPFDMAPLFFVGFVALAGAAI